MKPLRAAVFLSGAAIEAKAWDRFFCVTCQTERPIAIRVRFGRNNMPRCQLCVQRKSEPMLKKRGKPANPRQFDDDYAVQVETHIPDHAVEAYEEAKWDS